MTLVIRQTAAASEYLHVRSTITPVRLMRRSGTLIEAGGYVRGRSLKVEPARHASPFAWAPGLVIWEVTRACALKCAHCRADAVARRDPNELTTEQAKCLMRQVADFGTPPPAYPRRSARRRFSFWPISSVAFRFSSRPPKHHTIGACPPPCGSVSTMATGSCSSITWAIFVRVGSCRWRAATCVTAT
jgi:hypothetical protein